ncbi:DUF6443 domain-containing protein [Sphingobacterium sp.]|uniref:DUF6443 domain-containing protein n=1 Tax=Sphingobacterium sp. TaxID=341027 RepID=UPI00258FB6BB|nr:DUF6443 domain-containing protein [Sphingobacterium sp.]WET69689.1 MAG: DUF6443 domain-containing protein [Sphingobacterium sp.]
MKKNFLTLLSLFGFVTVYGQTLPKDTILNAYTNQTNIRALNSITLQNGFYIPAPAAGKTITISITGFQNIVSTPTAGQNYILTKTFRSPGVTLVTLNAQRTIGEENQSIQYFDGLGRPNQTVQLMVSPTYKDIVQHIEYDGFGRENTKYLPYGERSGNGSFRPGAKATQSDFYKDGVGWDAAVVKTPNPYAVTVFENSPLNRVLELGAPGAAWQPLAAVGTGHTIKTSYGANAASGADAVALWGVTTNGASSTTNYVAGKLYRTTARDENTVNTTARSGSVDEYKDFEGRVVLKRVWENESNALNTFYVYDDFGDLRYVIPPAVTGASFSELSADPTFANFDNYIYAYRYDERRRLVEKKIPGKGWEYLVYNKNDQVVLTQDAEQRVRKEWNYSRYDAFGRITSSGLYTNTTKVTRAEVAALVDAATGPLWETRSGADYPAPATTFPLVGTGITITPLIVNYYDDYAFSGATTLPVNGITKSTNIKSLQTGAKVYRTDGTLPLLTVMYYDDYGRVIQSASKNHLDGTDYVTNTYSFPGELLTSTRVHTPATGSATTIITTNEYDHVGRLVSTKERIGSQGEVTLASNSYNEIGQLKSKAVGKTGLESDFVNTTTYTYNERGWLSKSSSPKFSQQLKYQDGTNPQWNGNISQQLWGDDATLTGTFSYQYDKLNRLISGTNGQTGTASIAEVITYDDLGMGNIKTLKRDALPVTTYTYTGNKLMSLSGGLSGNYTYDANGNAKTDRMGMAITYNYLNLPQTAKKVGTDVAFLYNAAGVKLQKISKIGTSPNIITTIRDYVGGIEYNNGTVDIIHNSEGYAQKNGTNYVYHYNLTDHLGNVRATLKRGATAVDVTQRDNYYPFGKRKIVVGGNNKYLYNGKEIQGELGDQYDYGARLYDSEIGRWNAVDLLAEQMRRHSPYNYAFDNPIRFIDPDGMYPGDFINEKGRYLGNDGIEDGRVYVIKTSKESFDSEVPSAGITGDQAKATEKFITKNSGNTAAFQNNDVAYVNSVEIEGAATTRQQMVNIVNQDNGKGAGRVTDANSREYGGAISNTGVVTESPPGAVAKPGAPRVSITLISDNKTRSTFHSHPSASVTTVTGGSSGNTISMSSSSSTAGFAQAPSYGAGLDVNSNQSSQTNYVFGRGNGTVYIYNQKTGVVATMPQKYFVTPKK